MPDNKQMKIQWITINGRQVPLVLPQTYSYADDDWKVTSDRDPLPIVEYGTTEGGVIVPKRVSDEGHELTQLTGSYIEDIKQYLQDILNNMLQEVKTPIGFTWIHPLMSRIYKKNDQFIVDFDVSYFRYEGGGKTYYVDLHNGNDNNNGLTPENSLKSIHVARAKEDCETIIVESGYYEDLHGLNNERQSSRMKNINIIAADGAEVVISTQRRLNWTKTEGKENVYQASRTLVASVYDEYILDENGEYTKMTEMESLDDVDLSPGSYFYDGTTLYVHTCDSRPAGRNDICVFLDIVNLCNHGNYRTYVEGIKFYGGKSGCIDIDINSSSDNALFVAKNCEFKYASGGSGGLQIRGADAYLQNCIAAKNYADGFNYHHSEGRKNKVIEIECIGRHNGIGRGTNTDNGSTMHDGGKIIRINGKYYSNEGPNIHDINPETESWNLGCQAYDSSASVNNRNSNFRIEQGGRMWLDTCSSHGSVEVVTITSGSVMYLKNLSFDDGEIKVSGRLVNY